MKRKKFSSAICFRVILLCSPEPLELSDISMQFESWPCPSEGQLKSPRLTQRETHRKSERAREAIREGTN